LSFFWVLPAPFLYSAILFLANRRCKARCLFIAPFSPNISNGPPFFFHNFSQFALFSFFKAEKSPRLVEDENQPPSFFCRTYLDPLSLVAEGLSAGALGPLFSVPTSVPCFFLNRRPTQGVWVALPPLHRALEKGPERSICVALRPPLPLGQLAECWSHFIIFPALFYSVSLSR